MFFIKIYTKTHKIALYFMITSKERVLKRAAIYILLFSVKSFKKKIFKTKSD